MSQLAAASETRDRARRNSRPTAEDYRRVRHVNSRLKMCAHTGAAAGSAESVPVALVALVGYTNAGKSTLFNVLTKSKVLESSRMFATLDPTIRGRSCHRSARFVLGHGRFHTASAHTLVSAFAQRWKKCNGRAHSASLDASSRCRRSRTRSGERTKELEADKKPRWVDEQDRSVAAEAGESLRVDWRTRANDSRSARRDRMTTLLDRIDAVLEGDRRSGCAAHSQKRQDAGAVGGGRSNYRASIRMGWWCWRRKRRRRCAEDAGVGGG